MAGFVFFGIFGYQMYHSIVKYISKPTESFTTWQLFEKLPKKPLLTVCPKDQFNATAAAELGYSDSMAFLAGHTDGKIISWGSHKNMTFETLTEKIYGHMKVNVEAMDENDNMVAERSLFLANKGKCKLFSNYEGDWIGVNFTEQDFVDNTTYAMFITDPFDETNYNIGEVNTNGDKIIINRDSLGQINAYLISVEKNVKITKCYKYLDEKLSCMQGAAEDDLYEYLGTCLPPWLNKTLGCNSSYSSDKVFKYFSDKFEDSQTYDAATGFKVCNKFH